MRAAVVVLGALLAAGGLAACWLAGAAGVAPLAFGALLLLGTLAERHRYKRLDATAPGPGWQPNGERFIDPESGALVTVYAHERTGERRYVRGPVG